MKILWLFFLSLALPACTPTDTREDVKKYHLLYNVYGNRVSWEKYPVVFKIDSSVPSEFKPAIFRAAQKWNEESGKELIRILVQRGRSDSQAKDGENVIYFFSEWEINKSSEQGRTRAFWVGAELIEADILVNAKNYSFFSKEVSSPNISAIEIESLLVHEFGHVLGITHLPSDDSVMYSHLAQNRSRLKFTEKDKLVALFLASLIKP